MGSSKGQARFRQDPKRRKITLSKLKIRQSMKAFSTWLWAQEISKWLAIGTTASQKIPLTFSLSHLRRLTNRFHSTWLSTLRYHKPILMNPGEALGPIIKTKATPAVRRWMRSQFHNPKLQRRVSLALIIVYSLQLPEAAIKIKKSFRPRMKALHIGLNRL